MDKIQITRKKYKRYGSSYKMNHMKIKIFITCLVCSSSLYGQQWNTNGLNPFGNGNSFGTSWNAPINIYTGNTFRAQFTTNGALTSLVGNIGDGLRIIDPTGGAGNLDLFTSGPGSNGGNETHTRFGNNGQISGQNNRFEFIGTTGIGNFYNVTQGSAWQNFSRLDVEQGRLGNNNFWRFGLGTGSNAARRVEIVDADQQVRISHTNGAYAELFTRTNGRFLIMPTGANTGFTTAGDVGYNPTERIDVNGTGRFRDVATATPNALFVGVRNGGAVNDLTMKRLDFTGNPNQVLLGDGTWGTATMAPPPANNGVSRDNIPPFPNAPYQLGDLYFLPGTSTPLTADRQVRLGGNDFIFSGNGNVGIGLNSPNLPTERLDVRGNARFRIVPAQGGQSLILGFQNGTNVNDVELSRLVFPNDNTVALLGDGTWGNVTGPAGPTGPAGVPGPVGPQGPAGASSGAHNGTSVSTLDNTKVAFGNDMGSTVAQLLSDREIPMNNHNVVFTNSAIPGTTTNRIGIGTSAPTAKLDVQLVAGTTNIADPTVLNLVNNRSGSNGNAFGQLVKVTGTNNQNCGIQLEITAGTGSTRGINSNIVGISPSSNNNIGVFGGANVGGNPTSNIGVYGVARAARVNTGGNFQAAGSTNSTFNYGVNINVDATGNAENVGVRIQTAGTGNTNYGILSRVISTSGTNLGVWSFIANPNTGTNRAGKFQGKLEATAPLIVVSDQQFKTNVSGLSGSLKLLSALKPVSYNMDIANYSKFGFDDKLQYGFIAQDVANVFPNLVYDGAFHAQYDSLGNVTDTAVNYKSLNYLGFIPVNTAAIIELNKKVDAISLSDQSIKTNVQDLSGSLAKVLDMRGVSYDWNHTVHPELNLDSANHVGFIAQEIQQVDPRLTFLADDSLLHVKYEKVVPILAEAIQELNGQVESKDSIINAQSAQITDLNNRLTQLENCLSGILPYLCQLNQSAIQANTPAAQEEVRRNLSVTLSNRETIILDQNVPNPFAEQTVINFSIPQTVQKAQIHFYDGQGKLIQSVDVAERGLGSLTVFGSDLSTGVYTYTLVADGQVVATKKMMKE